MAHVLEPNPFLASPEYWEGLEITQPSDHGVSGISFAEVGRLTERLTNRAIRKTLQGLVETGECQELPVALDEVNKLDVLTPVVVETEDLAYFAGITGRTSLSGVATGQDHAPSIGRPFTEHWRRFHHRGLTQLGIELMVLPEEGISYTRTVEWGVTYPLDKGGLGIRTWDLGAPSVIDGMVVLDRDAKEDRNAWVINDSVGKVREIYVDGPLFGLHMFNRVRSVHQLVAKPQRNRRNFSDGFTEKARRLADKLDSILPKPVPLPGIG